MLIWHICVAPRGPVWSPLTPPSCSDELAQGSASLAHSAKGLFHGQALFSQTPVATRLLWPCLLGISCVPGQAGWGQGRCAGGHINEIDHAIGYLYPFPNADPDLSASSAELDAEHSQKVLEMEQTQQLKLKERQKFFEEAFQQDMEQYLSTGYLQIAERRGKSGSPLEGVHVGCCPQSGAGVRPQGSLVTTPELKSGCYLPFLSCCCFCLTR